MKLGCGTFTWAVAGLDLLTALREIADLGIHYVDLAGCLHGDPRTLSDAEKVDTRVLLERLGLVASSLLAVDPLMNIAAEEADERQAVRQYAEAIVGFAGVLGARQVLFKPGDKTIDVPNRKAWENALLFSQRLADRCAEAGVFLTFELEWRTCGLVQTIAQMERFLADVDRPNALANIDLGHVALARDGVADLERIAPKTIHLHLNDNDTFVHTNDIPGTGRVPLPRYVSALVPGAEAKAREVGEVLVAGIEIEPGARAAGAHQAGAGPLQSPRDICAQARDWVLANLAEVEP